MTRFLSLPEVRAIHEELMAESGTQSLVIAPEKLAAAVERPQATAFGEPAYAMLADQAAALLQSLVIGHAFLDGNKRVGFASAQVFLKLNGVPGPPDEDAAYDLVMAVATGEVREVDVIAGRLRELFTGLA